MRVSHPLFTHPSADEERTAARRCRAAPASIAFLYKNALVRVTPKTPKSRLHDICASKLSTRKGKYMEQKVRAMLHSINDYAEVTILSHTNDNNVIAEVNGVRCRAIFNPFAGCYYVDDKYGILPNQLAQTPGTPERKKHEPQR